MHILSAISLLSFTLISFGLAESRANPVAIHEFRGRSLPSFPIPGSHADFFKRQNPPCNTTQGVGNCIATSACDGFSIPGHCAGGTNIQCCIQKQCTTSQGSGSCLNKAKGCPGGSFVAGGCPANSAVGCCVKGAKSGLSTAASPKGGPPTAGAAPKGEKGDSSNGGSTKGSSPTAGAAPKGAKSGSTKGGSHPISPAALKLLSSLEGFDKNYYYINGDKTIGFGHDCTQRKDCGNIHPPLSRDQGMQLLKTDLVGYEKCVCALPNAANLNANEYGALVSFAYNAGCGGVSSSFRSYMSTSNFMGICNALPSKRTNGGQLSSRRMKESAFCKQPTNQRSTC